MNIDAIAIIMIVIPEVKEDEEVVEDLVVQVKAIHQMKNYLNYLVKYYPKILL
jgi:ATP-dependent RNA circularization protein (DNA/RNA ligase family)